MNYYRTHRSFASLLLLLLFVVAITVYHGPASIRPHDSSSSAPRRFLETVEELVPELWPLTVRDVLAFGLAAIGLLLAAGGGIGGGGILVPIYILVLRFTPKHAIPLSNLTVFGGALANLLLNVPKRHPVARRPLIDWDLILIMEPLTLAGALVGTNLNVLLPDVVILLCLVLLLTFTGYKTWQKAVKLHRQRTPGEGWHAVVQRDEDPTEESTTDNDNDDDTEEEEGEGYATHNMDIEMPCVVTIKEVSAQPVVDSNHNDPHHADENDESNPQESQELAQRQERQTVEDNDEDDGIALVELCAPKEFSNSLREEILRDERHPRLASIVTIAALFSFVLLVNLLKGGGAYASPLGVRCGSWGFWMLEGSIPVAAVGVTLHARSYLLWRGRRKTQADYAYLETDIRWTDRTTLTYPAVCTVAGLVAGLFGIGGGLVKAPLLLALGVHPAVASATSATMILFTTFTATTSFIVYGMLVWDYGLVCLCIGFCATLVGQVIMNALLRRTGRTSYIAFCIAGVVVVSAVAMTAEWSYALFRREDDDDHHPRPHEGSGFCGQE